VINHGRIGGVRHADGRGGQSAAMRVFLQSPHAITNRRQAGNKI